MREFINEFGRENFTIIAIVVLVILIALVLIVILEKTKIKKTLKRRAKMVLKSTSILKDEKNDSRENKVNFKEKSKEESSLIRIKKLLNSKALKTLYSIEEMENTINYSAKNKEININNNVNSNINNSVNNSVNNKIYQKPENKREYHYNERPITRSEIIDKATIGSVPHYENLTYTNEKADEVVYKKSNMTPEEAKEKLEEVTKKLVEQQNDVGLTVFEEEQEENSIISYDELVKASHDINEKNDKLLEDEMDAVITIEELYKKDKRQEEIKKEEIKREKVEVKETVPKRNTGSDVISPVYGRHNHTENKKIIDKYTNIKDEDNDVFLEKLKNLRSKLD